MFAKLSYFVLFGTILGCADLRVTRITEQARACGRDEKIKGFRYYLGRPYVLVKKAVPISETVELRKIEPGSSEEKVFASNDSSMHVTRHRPGSSRVEQVSAAEWKTLRSQIPNASGVVQAGHHTPETTVNVDMGSTITPHNAAELINSGVPIVPINDSVMENFSAFETTPTPLKDTEGAPNATPNSTSKLTGNIEIVYLPDFDEQYAVHNRNCLAKSSYDLKFSDGWALNGVNGEFDSTTVTLELLSVIDSAVTSAKTLGLSSLAAGGKGSGASTKESAKLAAARASSDFVEVRTATYLKPGLYRVSKPWEMGDCAPAQGCGFLSKLGLETITITVTRKATPDSPNIDPIK